VRYSSSSTLLDVFISEDTNATVSASLSAFTGVNLVNLHRKNEIASLFAPEIMHQSLADGSRKIHVLDSASEYLVQD
jgi:hypothetical protein